MTHSVPAFDLSVVTSREFRLVGEFDAHASEQFDAQLSVREPGDLTVELSEVTFIDSSGLRSLILARQKLEEQGFLFRIVSPSPTVLRLFELSGISDYLEVT